MLLKRKPANWYAPDCSQIQIGKRVYHSLEMCAGPIPTEIGRLTAMTMFRLFYNKLTGRLLFAHKSRLGKRVYHSPEICAGAIPTEIGQLTAMTACGLGGNELTGRFLITHKSGMVNEFTTSHHVLFVTHALQTPPDSSRS